MRGSLFCGAPRFVAAAFWREDVFLQPPRHKTGRQDDDHLHGCADDAGPNPEGQAEEGGEQERQNGSPAFSRIHSAQGQGELQETEKQKQR